VVAELVAHMPTRIEMHLPCDAVPLPQLGVCDDYRLEGWGSVRGSTGGMGDSTHEHLVASSADHCIQRCTQLGHIVRAACTNVNTMGDVCRLQDQLCCKLTTAAYAW
jgi:hypothetical protein